MREFESRLFDISTQKSTLADSKTGSSLYEGGVEEDEIDESQLMALCSGAFVTQKPEAVSENSPPEEIEAVDAKAALLSSDEEDEEESSKPKKLTKKNQKLNFSDDEDESDSKDNAEVKELNEEQEDEQVEEEEEENDMPETFIEYDSDENEVNPSTSKNIQQKYKYFPFADRNLLGEKGFAPKSD